MGVAIPAIVAAVSATTEGIGDIFKPETPEVPKIPEPPKNTGDQRKRALLRRQIREEAFTGLGQGAQIATSARGITTPTPIARQRLTGI
jgi:hypothetical protein